MLPPSTRLRGRSGSASSASRSTCRRCPAVRRCAPGLCRRPSSSGATSPAGSPAARRRSTASGLTARWVTTDAASGAALGAELAASPVPTGLLLLADGAACHGPKAPRAEDSRAAAYEEAVNDALAAGDPAALAALDPHLGAELSATGPELWPLLSAAAGGADWSGELLHSDAPYGVGWSVAVWRRAPAGGTRRRLQRCAGRLTSAVGAVPVRVAEPAAELVCQGEEAGQRSVKSV